MDKVKQKVILMDKKSKNQGCIIVINLEYNCLVNLIRALIVMLVLIWIFDDLITLTCTRTCTAHCKMF